MVVGTKHPHIRNSSFEAFRAATLLSKAAATAVPVTGILVIVDPKSLTIKERPVDVVVLTQNQLLRWLANEFTALRAHVKRAE